MEAKVAVSMRVALIMVVVEAAAATAAAAAKTDRRACTRSCGNISIPYPFGIEPGCYYAAGFNLTCKHHPHRPPELLLGDGTVQVLEISVPNATVRINSVVVKFPGGADTHTHGTWGGALGEGGPYYLAEMRNKLVASGCNVQLLLTGDGNQTVSACSAFCNEDRDGDAVIYVAGHCSGVGCCEAEILVGRSSYGFQVMGMNGAGAAAESNGWACIVESELNTDPDQLAMVSPSTLPAVLGWRISHTTCHRNKSSHACRSNHSFCEDIATEYATIGREQGHICRCAQGYEGNPYVPNGCHDVDECKSPGACYGDCTNTDGGYQCRCPPGFEGNASIPNGCKDIDECAHRDIYPCYGICINMPGTFHCQCSSGTSGNPLTKGGCKASIPVLTIGLGVCGGIGLLLLVIATPFILRKIKLQKARKMKQRFFKQNHGLLLQQLISQNADIGGRMIVTLDELEKATNNFDASHKVGGGGHGVVYKGLLNLQVVAIKKSKIIVQREIDEFINEVVILSQINHRNVVKLLGCCLETEVPLLVYEFISNGTLAHHLHVEGPKSLSWDDRLRIALEISRALAYLHSAAKTPILHRDIKSSNILLDDNLTAKVSDFGASKYIQIDQTGVTTVVQGTIGYLDPMYYYTCRLTDKSDVFSFGVLLIELLTRKKPFVYRTSDGESLVSHFASLLAEGRLVDIIDPQIIEDKGEHVDEIATLGGMCTKLDGEDRPTMRNVEMTLERLRVTKMQVHHNITSRRKYEKDRTASHYMSLGGLTVETSRQYTMEEEILLSARYPR